MSLVKRVVNVARGAMIVWRQAPTPAETETTTEPSARRPPEEEAPLPDAPGDAPPDPAAVTTPRPRRL